MSGLIFEGTGVTLVCDRVVVGSKIDMSSINGGFGGEDGGGGGYGSRGGGSGSNSNNTNVYYKKMVHANPGNPLLLTNYVRFLQEVSIKESELCFNLLALSCCYITNHLSLVEYISSIILYIIHHHLRYHHLSLEMLLYNYYQSF
jgi:hypothetical protein